MWYNGSKNWLQAVIYIDFTSL